MKKLLHLLLVTCLILALTVGCSQKTNVNNESNEQSGERSIKDEIVFAQGSDLTTMDPNIGTQERAYSLTNNMYDPLLTFDSDMNIQPCLATKWEWLDDLSLKLELRKDVKFHNGEDFTAEDVEFTINKIQDSMGALNGYFDYIEIIDDYNVIFHLTSPEPSLVNTLTDPMMSMLPKDYYNSDPKGFAAKPVGTGPYKMKEYTSGDYYTLERFEDYWGEPAKTRLLTLKIVPESGQRTILLETGEIDVAYEIPYNSLSSITENKKLQLLSTPSMKIVMLYFNTRSKGPAGNRLVRQAAEYALDKQSIVDAVCYGNGTATWTVVPSKVTDYVEQEGHKYNVAKAKELMTQAGYTNGCDITLWTNSNQDNTEISQILQSQLSEIGINLNIIVQDSNTTNTLRKTEDFGTILHFFQCNSGHAEYTLGFTMKSTSPANFPCYNNAEYDEIFSKWQKTTDETKRKELLNELYAIEQNDMPMIPLYNEVKMIGATKNLEGLQLSQIGAHEYQNAVVYED